MEAAVADLRYVYATTARERGQAKPVLAPSAAMGALAEKPDERRGILFGPERTGLDNDDVAIADAVVTFPTNPAYASLNLAQAVLLCGYEWFKAAHGDAPPPAVVPRPVSPPAQREMLLAFFDYLEGKLDEKGFFRPETKKPVMRRNLRNIFHRMTLTQQDLRTLWGAMVRLAEGPRVEVQTRKRVRPRKAAESIEFESSPAVTPGRLLSRIRAFRAVTWALPPAPCRGASRGACGGSDDGGDSGGGDDGDGAPSGPSEQAPAAGRAHNHRLRS